MILKIKLFLAFSAFILIQQSFGEIWTPEDFLAKTANKTFPEILISASEQLIGDLSLKQAKIKKSAAYRNISSFNLALNQLTDIKNEIKKELKEKDEEELGKNYLELISEQMIFLESILGADLTIIEEMIAHFKSDPTKSQESIEDYLKPHLEIAKKFLEQYPTSLEYPLVQAELEQIKERITRSKSVSGSPLTSTVDQEKFTRIYRFLEMVSERASWRVPFVGEREIKAPARINITQQLQFVSLVQQLVTYYEHKNKTSPDFLSQLQEKNLTHLSPFYEHQLNNLALILSNLNQKLSNSDQYFSPNYIRVLVEQDDHISNEMEAEKLIIEEVSAEEVHQPKNYQEINGKVGLLVRLNHGFAMEHSEGFPEHSQLEREIDYLKNSLSNLSQNATQIELNRMSQVLERFQRSTQRLTERATWREKVKFHFNKEEED